MKKLTVALFAVLFLAVAALFVLHFAGREKGETGTTSGNQVNISGGIAYVNIDTVVFKFNMYADRREELLETGTAVSLEGD